MIRGPALLLIGYQRTESLGQILSMADLAGIKKIYVSIDGPKALDSRSLSIQSHIREILRTFEKRFGGELYVRFHKRNRGCAAAVISSCEWAFEFEHSLFILEDDCIPSIEFFDFVNAHKGALQSVDNLMMICGSQFAPESVTEGNAVYSKYPLIWGWFTTSSKWQVMRQAYLSQTPIPKSHSAISKAELRYWRAGAKRARLGRVDAWDTVLASYFVENGLKSILPPVPLVTNIGNDKFATHTKGENEFLNIEVGVLAPSGYILARVDKVDIWLKSHFYKISIRHLFTTRLTEMIDFFKLPIFEPLDVRFSESNLDFID